MKTLILAAALVLSASLASANPLLTCNTRGQMVDQIERKHNMVRQSYGNTQVGQILIEFWGAAETGMWVITRTLGDVTCVIEAGWGFKTGPRTGG